MEPAEVQALYGGDYAERYNAIWQESEAWAPEAAHHERTIASLLGEGTRWLDAGCGTGWNLSRFPGVERAGLDLSPDMLAQARPANPDALFFRQGDLRDDVAEWHDQWDLVTCTGQPWCYVSSLDEIKRVAANLAAWTAPQGRCFVPLFDLEDFTGVQLPYPAPGEVVANDSAVITGVFWSAWDAGGHHRDMVAPAVGYWIELFSRYFRRVEITRWPHDPPSLPVARRNLLASEKRGPDDDGAPAVVIWHPVPPSVHDEPEPEPEPAPPTDEAEGSGGPDADAGDGAQPVIEASPPPPDSPAPVRPPDHAEPGLPPGRLPGRGLYDQPLSYLVARFAPWKPAFWRSATRRAKKLRS